MQTRRTVDPGGTSLLLALIVLSKRSLGQPILAFGGPDKELWSESTTKHLVARNESTSDTGQAEASKQNITPLVIGLTAGLLVFFLSVILGWMYYRHVVRKVRRKAQREEEREIKKNERRTKDWEDGTGRDRSRRRSTLNPSDLKIERGERNQERAQRSTSRPPAGLERQSAKHEHSSISKETSILPSDISSIDLATVKSSSDRASWNSAHEPIETRTQLQLETELETPIQAYSELSSRTGSVSSASGSTVSSDSERTRFEVDRSSKLVLEVKGI